MKLKNSESQIEWRNTAYCLTQLKYNEKIFMKLLEMYDCYKERIAQSPEVKEYFMIVSQKVKSLNKPEMKQHLEDFENKINIDENSQLQMKKDNLLLQNQKKASNQKRRPSRAASNLPDNQAGDEEMVDAEARLSSARPMSLKKTRAQFEA